MWPVCRATGDDLEGQIVVRVHGVFEAVASFAFYFQGVGSLWRACCTLHLEIFSEVSLNALLRNRDKSQQAEGWRASFRSQAFRGRL